MKRLILLAFTSLAVAADMPPDFAQVFRILDERCVECHTADDAEGSLVLETYEGVLKGGESGKSVVPGRSGESPLIHWVRDGVEKGGKTKFMPPGKRTRLSTEDITLISKWIDAGAKPGTAVVKREINVPKVAPKVAVRASVNALAFSPQAKLLAIGRYGVVELAKPDTREVVHKLVGHDGNVNALIFSADGKTVFAASGENAVSGQIKIWNVADGRLLRVIDGHRDTIYALALSPDGKTLASGSYDQQIKLWDPATGAEKKTLRGHNGAVFGLAFRPDGKILASASADRTVKLWDAATGARKDTLIQPTKEQVAVAWSADGKRLAAAGFDNRIRTWSVRPDAKETMNPLLAAIYAHEQPITRLVWSADGKTIASGAQDGTVKLWEAGEIKERALLEKQPDWPSAIVFAEPHLIVGRLDGTVAAYTLADGKPIAAAAAKPAMKPAAKAMPPKPAKVVAFSPRGIERGARREVSVTGENLATLKSAKASNAAIIVEVLSATATGAKLAITTPADFPRAAVDVAFTIADGKAAGTLKLHVDDLPVIAASEAKAEVLKFPVVLWSGLDTPGDSDRYEFDATAGQAIVFDLESKGLGAKANAVLALVDREGHVLANSNDFDNTGDPVIGYTFKAAGRFAIVVGDLEMGGSAEHFYRLTAGALPFVTACYPLSVPPNTESEVELIGFNLPSGSRVKVKAGAAGEMPLMPDPAKFRARRGFRLAVSELPTVLEVEPNDTPERATKVSAPASIGGRIERAGDVDLFRFDAKKGSVWAIETEAAKRGTPVDTKIELLDAQGRKVERVLLRAVRDSAITFRAIDSNIADARVDNWREMELNQLMFMNGEVAKIFRMPEGPDSGFQFYTNAGKRVGYFDTTPIAQPLDQPTYIIEPHPPGAKLAANGLPVFTLFYENDDDGERELGTDSRVLFTAPADGAYLVRVSDSRGMGGARNVYRLVVREARPDFSVTLAGGNPALPVRSGQEFTLKADRKDGFDAPIEVAITGVPAGYKLSSHIVIEAGHTTAEGTIQALADAKQLDAAEWKKVKVTATANGITRDVAGFTGATLEKDPKVWVALESVAPGDTLEKLSPPTPYADQDPNKPFEITIAPGETIPAWIKIKRNGSKDAIRFDVQGLPHGVIVDNLGLNGITLLPEQSEGEIHIKAEPWVQEMDRLIYAKTRGGGGRGAVRDISDITSMPVILHVRKKEGVSRTVTVK
ncbi:MAG: c-type cytochrome domain-containing protein [Chthoniobacteraceae bacterium]